MCVAWSSQGIQAIGRKVFPTDWEGKNGYTPYEDDYGTDKRILRLSNDRIGCLFNEIKFTLLYRSPQR